MWGGMARTHTTEQKGAAFRKILVDVLLLGWMLAFLASTLPPSVPLSTRSCTKDSAFPPQYALTVGAPQRHVVGKANLVLKK